MIIVCTVFALLIGVPSGADACVTDDNKGIVDTGVNSIIGALVGAGHFDIATQQITTGVPEMLTYLCDSQDLRQAMEDIQAAIVTCLDLLNEAASLQMLQVDGISFGELFTSFSDADSFCRCQPSLPDAWLIRASTTQLTLTDSSAAFSEIANVGKICEQQLQTALTEVGQATTECRGPLELQAGFVSAVQKAKLEKILQLKNTVCPNYDSVAWECIQNKSVSADLKHCIGVGFASTGNTANCGKRVCIMLFVGDASMCGSDAANLYMKAINMETPDTVQEAAAQCTDAALNCVTFPKWSAMNTAVQTIFMNLNVDLSAGIPDNLIPTIFTTLCTTEALKTAMETIQTEIGSCMNLALLARQLGLINIKGVSFADLFILFPSADLFCECSGGLVKAWALNADTTLLVYEDSQAAVLKIAHVSNICGVPLKDLVTGVGGASSNCKQILKNQANRTNIDDLYAIAQECGDGANLGTDWTCMTTRAKDVEFKSCMTTEGQKVGDGALCGKRGCVVTDMHQCSNKARNLYIKAVNLENPNRGIKEITDTCGASGIRLSLLMVVAYLALLFI